MARENGERDLRPPSAGALLRSGTRKAQRPGDIMPMASNVGELLPQRTLLGKKRAEPAAEVNAGGGGSLRRSRRKPNLQTLR